MKHQIAALVTSILKNMGFPAPQIEVTVPENPAHGDYTTSVAMKIWRSPQLPQSPQLRQFSSPMELALSVKEKLKAQSAKRKAKTLDHNTLENHRITSVSLASLDTLSAIDRVEVAPPGFINVFVTEAKLITHLQGVLKQREAVSTGKKIMVEFAHPNTHKAFHIGHLRNITTGESVARLIESRGRRVIRANYQGDVGLHIAKALYALLRLFQPEKVSPFQAKERVEFLGKAYAAGSKAYEEDPAAKDEIVSLNALIYAAAQRLARERGIAPGATDYLALVKDEYKDRLDAVYTLWKETRQWSLDYFETIYKRVGSRYDRYYFESECLAGADLSRDAVKKGVLKKDAGAIIFDGKPYNLDTRVFVNSLGLPTYEGKELALAKTQFTEHGKLDQLIHVLGPEQVSFTRVTFKVEELLGIQKDQQLHLVYGWVKLKHGKMSSRSGNVVLGEWLLDEAKKAIYDILERNTSKNRSLDSSASSASLDPSQRDLIAEKAAVAAVKYAFLKVGTRQEIAFDIQTSVSFDGDSGPYLLYTYARCKSVLRKAGNDVIARSGSDEAIPSSQGIAAVAGDGSLAMTLNPEERAVARLLTYFPDVARDAAETFSPNTLCAYLFKLAQSYNLFYAKHTILPPNFPNSLRLALTAACARVLKEGLYLLGIDTLERM